MWAGAHFVDRGLHVLSEPPAVQNAGEPGVEKLLADHAKGVSGII